MAIGLRSKSGADYYTESGLDPNDSTIARFDVFAYHIEIAPGEYKSLTGSFSDPALVGDIGQGYVLVGPAPDFGSFAWGVTGYFSYTFTFDQAYNHDQANGALGTTVVSFQMHGKDWLGDEADTDTVEFHITFACFAAGTGIATQNGERSVETLQIGDLICTADGRDVAVKWVGHQTMEPATMGAQSEPVLIRSGAFGMGLPLRDLTVTADHGMILDGMIVNAGALVGAAGIDWVASRDLPARFTVYHIETADHEVILANGAAAETFCDGSGRKAFDNYDEYLELLGTQAIVPVMQLPRISSARLLPEHIKRRLGMGAELKTMSCYGA